MGKAVGFEDLYRHREDVARAAGRILGSDPCVDDVVQDTYVVAMRHTVEADGNPRGWLVRVAENLARKQHRSRVRRERREASAPRRVTTFQPEEQAVRQESRDLLADALQGLPSRYREAVLLRFIEGLDYPSIASRLFVTQESARSRVRRALIGLRIRLTRLFSDREHGVP